MRTRGAMLPSPRQPAAERRQDGDVGVGAEQTRDDLCLEYARLLPRRHDLPTSVPALEIAAAHKAVVGLAGEEDLCRPFVQQAERVQDLNPAASSIRQGRWLP